MKISEIKSVRICGIDFEVDHSDPRDWSTGGMGRASEIDGRISIRTGMNDDIARGTLLHEVIHMIVSMNAIKCLEDDEQAVTILAAALNAFFRDNDVGYREGGK